MNSREAAGYVSKSFFPRGFQAFFLVGYIGIKNVHRESRFYLP